MGRRGAFPALVLGVILASAGVALAAVTPVLDNPRVNEGQPAASEGYLVWTQGTKSFLKPEGVARIRINPVGTESFAASIDGTTVVFQQHVRHKDDLFLFDVTTGSIGEPPHGVNTSDPEYEPSISGDWLLFTRADDRRLKVILFNLITTEQRVVANLRARTHHLISDQVNGDWATWESCDLDPKEGSHTNCQAFRYRIGDDEVEMLPNPGKQQYAAGVTTDGTAYLIRTGRSSEWRCGAGARIIRIDPDGDGRAIAGFPKGRDSFNTFAFEEPDGSTTLYFERVTCSGLGFDIFKLEDADTA